MIGIGEYRVGSFPMMTIGLGSCIGLTLYDDTLKVGAMVHIMLPDSAGRTDRPGKYADTAIVLLLNELTKLGCKNNRSLSAKMAGGACMFEYFGANLNIGQRESRSLGYVPPVKSWEIYYQESRWYKLRTLIFSFSSSSLCCSFR
jgi:chemotaxis protein CheD